MRRAISLTILVLTALLLQTTVFSEIQLLGVKPELVYLVVILIAVLEGPTSGAGAGFAGGMAQDFLLNQPKGITALTLTLLGYSVGMLRQYIVSPSAWLPVFLVGASTAAGEIFHGLVRFLLGQLDTGWGFQFRVAILAGLYNALLTPVVFPVIRRVTESSRTRKVLRW
ncbi:MAG: rod shape-determining protein MreD [Actinomycetota bacterium]